MFIREDKATGEKEEISEEKLLHLLDGVYKEPKKVIESITENHPLSLSWSIIHKGGVSK